MLCSLMSVYFGSYFIFLLCVSYFLIFLLLNMMQDYEYWKKLGFYLQEFQESPGESSVNPWIKTRRGQQVLESKEFKLKKIKSQSLNRDFPNTSFIFLGFYLVFALVFIISQSRFGDKLNWKALILFELNFLSLFSQV